VLRIGSEGYEVWGPKPVPAPNAAPEEFWTLDEAFVYALARVAISSDVPVYPAAYMAAAEYAAREPRRRAALAALCAEADAAYGRGSPAARAFRAGMGDARPALFVEVSA